MYENAFAVLVDDRFSSMLRRRIRRERCGEGDVIIMIIYLCNQSSLQYNMSRVEGRDVCT